MRLDGIEVLVDCFLISYFHFIVNLLTDSLAPRNLDRNFIFLTFMYECTVPILCFYAGFYEVIQILLDLLDNFRLEFCRVLARDHFRVVSEIAKLTGCVC